MIKIIAGNASKIIIIIVIVIIIVIIIIIIIVIVIVIVIVIIILIIIIILILILADPHNDDGESDAHTARPYVASTIPVVDATKFAFTRFSCPHLFMVLRRRRAYGPPLTGWTTTTTGTAPAPLIAAITIIIAS